MAGDEQVVTAAAAGADREDVLGGQSVRTGGSAGKASLASAASVTSSRYQKSSFRSSDMERLLEEIEAAPEEVIVPRVVVDHLHLEIDLGRIRAEDDPSSIHGDPERRGRVEVVPDGWVGFRVGGGGLVEVGPREAIALRDVPGQDAQRVVHEVEFSRDRDAYTLPRLQATELR